MAERKLSHPVDFTNRVRLKTGKTITFAKLIEEALSNNENERILIMAHRGELLEQAADKLRTATKLESVFDIGKIKPLNRENKITISSVQSMQQDKRLAKYGPDYFTLIIIDEAHHALSKGYVKVLNYFKNSKALGVTATPDRADKKDLKKVFPKISFEFSIEQALQRGYLSPIKTLTLPVKIDLNKVPISKGDFKQEELGNALDPYLESIGNTLVTYAKNRKTVIFLPLIRTAQKMQKILQKKGFRVAEINGQSKDRAVKLKDFDNDKYDVLCNSMLLTEGWDSPKVDCVVMLRPTKSRALYMQAIGRGLRLCKGKEDCLVLDFLWESQKLSLIRPAHILTKNQKVAEKMLKAQKEHPGQEVNLEELKDYIEAREKALAKQLEQLRNRKKQFVDPLLYFSLIEADEFMNYQPMKSWERKPPTEKQKEILEKMGMFPDDISQAGIASLLIKKLVERQKKGLLTARQIKTLNKFGIEHLSNWTFEDGKEAIDEIAKHRWKISDSERKSIGRIPNKIKTPIELTNSVNQNNLIFE